MNIGMHASHCCKWHGCKYNDPDCPVVSGKVEQEYPCEWCSELLKEEEYYKKQLTNLLEIKTWLAMKKLGLDRSCNYCGKINSCEKARHFENYRFSGCSDFMLDKEFIE